MVCSIPLEVPFAEKGTAKALGARWDPRSRTWSTPNDDFACFESWLPEWCEDEVGPLPTVSADVVALRTHCERCKSTIWVIAGALVTTGVDRRDFLLFDEVAYFVVTQVTPRLLASKVSGIRFHRGPGYEKPSNTCRACGTTFWSHLLLEDLVALDEKTIERFPVIATIELPVPLLAYAQPL